MTKMQISRTKQQMLAMGFEKWQADGIGAWAANLKDRRQWRRMFRKVFGASALA